MARTTKDTIRLAALETFSQKGFAETTMDMIAAKAGVAKGTLYYNYKTKEELFIHVMKLGIRQLTNLLNESLHVYADDPKKWQYVILAHLEYFEKNRAFFHLFIQNMWGANVQQKVSLQELLGEYFQTLDEALRDLQRSGRLDPYIDIQTFASALVGMITVPAARAILHNQPLNHPSLVHTLNEIIGHSMEAYKEEKRG